MHRLPDPYPTPPGRPFPQSLTTTVLSQRRPAVAWGFPRRAAPKSRPSSFTQQPIGKCLPTPSLHPPSSLVAKGGMASDLRLVTLQTKTPRSFRAAHGADRPTKVRSYITSRQRPRTASTRLAHCTPDNRGSLRHRRVPDLTPPVISIPGFALPLVTGYVVADVHGSQSENHRDTSSAAPGPDAVRAVRRATAAVI